MTTELLKTAIEGYKKDIKELDRAYKPIAKISDAHSKAMLQDLVIERIIKLNEKMNVIEHLIKKLDTSSTKNEINSPLSNAHATENEKVVPSQDKIGDIHSQNKELLDKDYSNRELNNRLAKKIHGAKDKLNATESK